MSLRLHPRYGANPTISECIICGKPKNEVVLLGAAFKEEAPPRMVIDPTPCDECRKKYFDEARGVMLVAVVKEDGKVSLTGGLAIITEDAFKRNFDMRIPEGRIVFAEPKLVSLITKQAGEKK